MSKELTLKELKNIAEGYKIILRKIKLFKDDNDYIIPINHTQGVKFWTIDKVKKKESFYKNMIRYYGTIEDLLKNTKEEYREKEKQRIEKLLSHDYQIYTFNDLQLIPVEIVAFYDYKGGKIITFLGIIKTLKQLI